MKVLRAAGIPDSPARVSASIRSPFRIGAVQHQWHPDPVEHRGALSAGVAAAVEAGAQLVCLQELTLSPYFAITPSTSRPVAAEPLPGGPTHAFAADLAAAHGVPIHASLFEVDPGEGGPNEGGPNESKPNDGGPDAPDRVEPATARGFNTAIVVGPDGALLARTRKIHIPITAGYYEDQYFRGGDRTYPVVSIGDARCGFPTCWDQWFPDLAREYSLAGAEVLIYPTAIGSEPDHPGFDTQPLWEHVIRGNGITSGTFMVAVNRIGTESATNPRGGTTSITFYGSSFISDPYGRVLVQAPRDEPAVIIAELDLDQRRDWLDLFPFLTT